MEDIEVVYERGAFKPVHKISLKKRVHGHVIIEEQHSSLFGSLPDLKQFTENDRADAR